MGLLDAIFGPSRGTPEWRVVRAKNLGEIQSAFLTSWGRSKQMAQDKWESIAREQIYMAVTHDHFKELIWAIPDSMRSVAIEKWLLLCDDVRHFGPVYAFCRPSVDCCTQIMSKWLLFCKTRENAEHAHFMADKNTPARVMAAEKLASFSLGQITEAITVNKAMAVYLSLPDESTAKDVSFKKWVSICSTPEEVSRAISLCHSYTEIRSMAERKWEELCKSKTRESSTSRELELLWSEVTRSSCSSPDVIQCVLQKWLSLTRVREEIVKIYELAPSGSKAEKDAHDKLISLGFSVDKT